ncbi:MAG: hypothetical protein JSS69_16585 [Acidobacteria bacterium]|nr:hypothetical protein [Acidobacteriota bacterium]MBS1867533.1 hypothetical protein [Acidobacteriota bacterium]
MKAFRVVLFAAMAVSLAAPTLIAEPRQLLQGTQIHLQLLTDISTGAAKDGDPFLAIVTEPVTIGDQTVLPAGTRVRGEVTTINKARRFSIFRGEAYLNLSFRSVEIDSRLIPVQMSLLSISKPTKDGEGRRRKDVKITEGQVVEEKHDIKGDVIAGTIGTGGGTLVGTIFSHAVRGFGIGLAGSAVYVVARKGKEVDLPARTGMTVRMDSTITVPGGGATNASYTTTGR